MSEQRPPDEDAPEEESPPSAPRRRRRSRRRPRAERSDTGDTRPDTPSEDGAANDDTNNNDEAGTDDSPAGTAPAADGHPGEDGSVDADESAPVAEGHGDPEDSSDADDSDDSERRTTRRGGAPRERDLAETPGRTPRRAESAPEPPAFEGEPAMGGPEAERPVLERVQVWLAAFFAWLGPQLRAFGSTVGRAAGSARRALGGRKPARPSLRSAASRAANAPPAGSVVATADDDVSSLIGAIDTATEMDLVLIVPREARALRDPMAWPRLVAHMRRRGGTLRVLAARGDVVQHARTAGLRASRSVRGLREPGTLRIPVGSREFRVSMPRVGPWLRGGIFAAAVAAALVGACYFVPSASVVIEPPSEPFEAAATVQLNPLILEPNAAAGVVPVTTLRRTITTIVTTTTTGTTEVGADPAVAELTFTNDGETDIEVPAGTVVTDEGGTAFATDDTIVVPAGESVAVPATAERGGTGTNLDAGEIRLIVGFPSALTVSNAVAASGGTDQEVAAIAQEDIDRVTEIAPDVLDRIGARELQAAVEDGFVFDETVNAAIVSFQPLGAVGQPGEAFLMEYTAVVTALYLTQPEANAFGEQLLLADLPAGAALLPGTTTVRLGDVRQFDGVELNVELVATGLTTDLFEPAELRSELAGVAPEAAAQRLRERLNLSTEPRIQIEPSWLPAWRMPFRDSRISINLVGPGGLAEADADEGDVDGDSEPAEGDADGGVAGSAP